MWHAIFTFMEGEISVNMKNKTGVSMSKQIKGKQTKKKKQEKKTAKDKAKE